MSTLIATIKNKIRVLPQTAQSVLLAVTVFTGLTLQLLLVTLLNDKRPPRMPGANSITHSLPVGGVFMHSTALRVSIALLIIAIGCSALIFRKKLPWSALIITTACAALYTLLPLSPVFIIAVPLVAMYNVTASSEKNTRWVIIFFVVALALCLFALTYATSRWAIELVGFTAFLTAGALFGAVRRSDKAYLREAQQRALEAERTREQEAQKRVEAERVAVAREVHDIVAHSISIIAVQSAAADTLIDAKPEAAHRAVNNIRETSKQALSELRGMINVLRNDATNLSPLAPVASLPAIDEVIERVSSTGIKVYLENNTHEFLPAPVSVSAYRILQEALTNILRHSNATSVRVIINQDTESLTINITDNGVYKPLKVNQTGHGIQGMRERCDALGGTFKTSLDEVNPASEAHGFSIYASLPIVPDSK